MEHGAVRLLKLPTSHLAWNLLNLKYIRHFLHLIHAGPTHLVPLYHLFHS